MQSVREGALHPLDFQVRVQVSVGLQEVAALLHVAGIAAQSRGSIVPE